MLKHDSPRQRFFSIAIPSGIAACLLGMAVLVWLINSSRPVSAADQLAEAVSVSGAYKGWIRETFESAVIIKPPSESVLTGERPKNRALYSNTTDGSFAEVVEFSKGMNIEYLSVKRRESATYKWQTNEIQLHTVYDAELKTRQTPLEPFGTSELLAFWKKQTGHDPFSLKKVREGNLDRFDMVLFASQAEAEKFRHDNDRVGTLTGCRWWVDGRKLITKAEMDLLEGTVTADISYDIPEPTDIYALGAPRDAKVVDNRNR